MNMYPVTAKRRGRPPKEQVSVFDPEFFDKVILKEPKGKFDKRVSVNWELVDCYDTLDEALVMAKRNKVSKRKVDELQNGRKITFR